LKAAKQTLVAPAAFSETLDMIPDRLAVFIGPRRGSIGLNWLELLTEAAGGDLVGASSGQFLIE
jgi:hypothetical protein